MQGTFKEVGRLRTTDTTELVLSEVHSGEKLRGYAVSKYVTSEEYTGWSKGIFIPEDLLIEFLMLFDKEDLELALQ